MSSAACSWSIHLVNIIASSLAWAQAWTQLKTNGSPQAWSLGHRVDAGVGRKGRREQGGVVGADGMVDLQQPGLGGADIAPRNGIMLRPFEWHVQSQRDLLIPGKACGLQLCFVIFNRKTRVAFWTFCLGVYPASHLYLNKTSAQPAHTYPGANLKQPWLVNGVIPGLPVQQAEISTNYTICFLFNGNKWKLLEQRDIWSQAELLGLDFITNLKLGPVLMGFVNAFNKRGPSFKWGWAPLRGNLGQGMVLSGKHMKLSAFSWFRVLLWSTWSIQT